MLSLLVIYYSLSGLFRAFVPCGTNGHACCLLLFLFLSCKCQRTVARRLFVPTHPDQLACVPQKRSLESESDGFPPSPIKPSLFVRFCLVLFMLGRAPSGMYSSILRTLGPKCKFNCDFFALFSRLAHFCLLPSRDCTRRTRDRDRSPKKRDKGGPNQKNAR